MCANFLPAPTELIRFQLDWTEPSFDYRDETYVGYRAPIRLIATDTGMAEWREAMFGLVPFWAKDTKISRHTYNARTETVATKPSYRDAWRKRRFALVPMIGFFEPDYESGKAIRWRIERIDRDLFTVAAIWERWQDPNGESLTSFSLLTRNADGHPVMGRFHGPEDEKRSIVVIPPQHRDDWLRATDREATGLLGELSASEFTARPDPRPARVRKTSPG